jgi:hypothetical protein
VVAFDQRGHGLSDWPGRYSDRLLVADVVRVVEALALGRFALIGHSMGAAIAWEYAARNSDTVRCLILLDASPDPPGEIEAYVAGAPTPPGLASPDDIVEWATAQGWTDGVDGGDLDRWLARHARRSPDGSWVRGFDEAGYEDAYTRGRMWQSNRTDWRNIAQISCSTLVVIGEKGPVGQKLGELVSQRLDHGSLAGHPRLRSPRALAEPARHAYRGTPIPGRLPDLTRRTHARGEPGTHMSSASSHRRPRPTGSRSRAAVGGRAVSAFAVSTLNRHGSLPLSCGLHLNVEGSVVGLLELE